MTGGLAVAAAFAGSAALGALVSRKASVSAAGAVSREAREDSKASKAREAHERVVVEAVVASLDPRDKALGLKKEYRAKHASGCDPTTGFCSVAVEAVWAILGGNRHGYRRFQVRVPKEGSHWFLRGPKGCVIDPTATQFKTRVPYERGRGAAPPVTRKTGVLYRGDPELLISKKAARLIAKASRRLPAAALREVR